MECDPKGALTVLPIPTRSRGRALLRPVTRPFVRPLRGARFRRPIHPRDVILAESRPLIDACRQPRDVPAGSMSRAVSAAPLSKGDNATTVLAMRAVLVSLAVAWSSGSDRGPICAPRPSPCGIFAGEPGQDGAPGRQRGRPPRRLLVKQSNDSTPRFSPARFSAFASRPEARRSEVSGRTGVVKISSRLMRCSTPLGTGIERQLQSKCLA